MSRLGEVRLEPYQQLLQHASRGAALALCQASGELISASPADSPLAIRCLAALANRAPGWASSTEPLDTELAGGERVLRAPLEGDQGRVGWVVLCAPAGQDPAVLRRALDQLAACIAREFRLLDDVDGVTRELTTRYEELNLVYSLGGLHRSEGDELPFDELLQNLTRHLDLVVAALYPPGSRQPVYAIDPRRRPANADLLLTQLGGEVRRYTLAAGAPVLLNGPDSARRPYLLTHMPVKLLSCQVPAANREVGVLALVRSKDGADFSNGDRNLASVIASHIGIVLRNRHMLRGMQRFGEQMASALIEAIEAKDAYTGGHSERVRDLSVRIGRTMSLRSEQIDSLSWGGLLHDVGKVAIPDAILSKPCRLTDEEYTFIKVHPERSYEILRHIELLSQEALDGARFHQERFDGKGYPRGLRGYEIPLPARIIAVADTYDAMTTSRAYRPGQDHEAALQEIVKVAGSQLDPEVVDAFQRLCTDDLAWLSSAAASGGER